MKKIFLVLLTSLVCIFPISALTPLQQKAKSEIFNAIKKYGTNITDDGDERILFKYDGTTFIASVHSLNPQTLYLSLNVMFNLSEGYNADLAFKAAFNAAGNKPVCSFATDEELAFSCEMYAKEAKPFIAVLPEMLNALNTSAANFQDEYDELAKSYVPSSQNGSYVSNLQTSDLEFIYPKYSSNNDSKLYIKKVTFDENYTILDMVSYNSGQYQNCTLDKKCYLLVNGVKYNLIKAEGITYNPIYTDYPGYDSGREVSLNFKLYFPPLPKGTTSFDFMESTSEGWKIKGVEIKHGNSFAIYGNQIETSAHKWECKAIEIQNGQTILTKTVQPKSDGTYMYSSQDEFIEDADTGRKYYLLNSSIGFEGSPEISNDTKPITFYEVYPFLPSDVKRINISSGSQYYVKDLKIR